MPVASKEKKRRSEDRGMLPISTGYLSENVEYVETMADELRTVPGAVYYACWIDRCSLHLRSSSLLIYRAVLVGPSISRSVAATTNASAWGFGPRVMPN